MNTARYVAAVLAWIGTPPAIFLWYAIHPFARSWRRIGAGWTYAVLAPPALAFMVGLWYARDLLLGPDLGTSPLTIAIAVPCLVVSIGIGVRRRRLLTHAILAGVPELSPGRYPGTLLTEGPYARVRHPRYVEVMCGIGAYACFANYLGGYVLLALSAVALYLVVLLEERELVERFGDAYIEYAKRVPRFVPRRASTPREG